MRTEAPDPQQTRGAEAGGSAALKTTLHETLWSVPPSTSRGSPDPSSRSTRSSCAPSGSGSNIACEQRVGDLVQDQRQLLERELLGRG